MDFIVEIPKLDSFIVRRLKLDKEKIEGQKNGLNPYKKSVPETPMLF